MDLIKDIDDEAEEGNSVINRIQDETIQQELRRR